ncbi:MAG: translocation/assembly module TamB, partial [Desulfobulbaceae bacterium]|nr:translocation/assembly module TamB [Desulfobulbaceae bacterium]
RQGRDHLAASGTLLPADRALEDFSWSMGVGELAPYLSLFPALDVRLQGAMEMEARARGGWASPAVRASIKMASGALAGHGFQSASAVFSLAGSHLTVEAAQVRTAYGEATMAGQLVGLGEPRLAVTLDRLRLSRPGMAMALAAPARIDRDAAGRWQVAGLVLAGTAGRFTVNGSVAPAGTLDLKLDMANANTDGWLVALTGSQVAARQVDGTIRLTGSAAEPRLALAAAVGELRSPSLPEPLSGRLGLDCSRRGITVRELAFASRRQRLTASGHLPYDLLARRPAAAALFDFTAAAELAGISDLAARLTPKGEVSGSLKGDLRLTGSWERPVGRLRFSSRNLVLEKMARFLPPGPLALSGEVEAMGDRLKVHGLTLRHAALSAEVSGLWHGAPSLASLLGKKGPHLTGTLDLAGRLESADMGWLAALRPDLRRVSGRLHSSFRVTGPAGDPELHGAAQLTGGEVRFAAAVPVVRDLALRVAFDRRTARITEARGLIGGAPFTVGGEVRRRDGGVDLDLALHGRELLFLRNEDVTMRGNADLAIAGPLERLTMSGDVRLTGGSYRRNVDFLSLLRGAAKPGRSGVELFSLTAPPFRDAILKIRLHADAPFPVKNNLVRGGVRPEVLLTGTCEVPLLTGVVYVEPTRIELPAGRLEIESGLIRFPRQEPGRPTFDLKAKSRLAGYDITMLLTGNAEEPVITLSSVPPLPEEQLLLLVLTGRPPQPESGRELRRRAGMKMALYLGKGLLADWFGRGDEADETILDRFDLEVGRDITRQGEDTVEARFRMAEGVLLPGDRLFITSERDLFDDYNAGIKIVFRFR